MIEIPDKEYQKLQTRLKELESAVAERKRAEKALLESEVKFRAIFDSATDGILLADIETKKFIDGNKAMCDMLACSLDEIKKMGSMDIHPQENLPYVLGQFEKQAKGEITLAKAIPVKRKDGSVFYADISSGPIELAGMHYLMGIFRDITERKLAEEKIREKVLELQQIADAVTNRELKMMDLEKAMDGLLEELGRPPKYSK